mmetsp:Transcript_7906/g.12787  ORF Transcript_7906/g.12787 Transcript_7906/m.12787 type:complete len:365 (+) Transcript_7906:141-1235(+)
MKSFSYGAAAKYVCRVGMKRPLSSAYANYARIASFGNMGVRFGKGFSTKTPPGDDKGGDTSANEAIRRSFMQDEESPLNRRLTLDAKLRMLRVLDKIYDSKKDADTHMEFSRHARFGGRDVGFDDFLLADSTGDGRVSNAEWEQFLRTKDAMDSGAMYAEPNSLNIEVPLSPSEMHTLANDNGGFHIRVNGMRYKLSLTPEGETAKIIEDTKSRLRETLEELANMEIEKRPLDAKAARHTKRVMHIGLVYLLSQAAVIAKLTFFSRFGWDVMEPITYFITFGTAVMGFVFFQYHKIEYSYPALAAMLTQRKANRLYDSYDFNIDRYSELQSLAVRYEQKLLILQPPRALISPEKLDAYDDDSRE